MKRQHAIKVWSYVAVAVLLVAVYVLLEIFTWPFGGTQLHTIMEVIATLFAAIVGTIALVRYYSRRHNMMLFLGVGFAGTALLDGYHAIVTSSFFDQMFPSRPESLIPWSWNASRTFLAILMFLSWLAWRREKKLGEKGRVSDLTVYLALSVLTLISFAFFAFIPLGPAYFPGFIFGRPEEFVAAAFFAAALIGFVHKQEWREEPLDHWVVLSLLLGLFCQALFMSRSYALFDGMFDIAHSLKIISYGLVMVGLLTEMYFTWQREQKLAAELESRVEERTAQLSHANEALEHSNLELKQFAYIASHDLQSPLRAVAGFAQFLQEDYQGKLDATADQRIDRIVEGCQRMQTMINDLLTYSRVESRSRAFEATDLNEVFDDVVTLLRAEVEDLGGEITRDELPSVSGDRSQLSQLLQNLIGNGLKYHSDDPPRVHVSAEQSGSTWTVAVHDNGIGIDAQHHERIFEIFRRLHTQDKYPGTGIGLAVCRRVVHRHGGTIWLESEDGKGTTIYFTISQHGD